MKFKVATYLTLEERNELLEQPDMRSVQGVRDFCILCMMALCGLRRDEVCRLNRKGLKVIGKEVWLYVWGKGERERRVPIEDPHFIQALKKYFAMVGTTQEGEAPMFLKVSFPQGETPQRITWSVIRHLVSKYAEDAKIERHVHPHVLRHTALTLAHQAGASAATVQALAGHSNIQTTSRYLHTSDKLMREAVASLRIR